MTLRLALAQVVSGADPAANLELVADQTAAAAAAGAELVVFPEATMRSFAFPAREVAEPADGPWASGLRRVADRHDVVLAAGMFVPAPDGRVRNVLRVVGRGLDAAYAKIHLFDAFGFRESASVAPGADLGLVEVAGGSVGLALCYDVRFPGLFYDLADAGASLVVLAASWAPGPGKVEQWQLLVRARALDSTCFVAAASQGDPRTVGLEVASGDPTGVGHSMLVSPLGEVLDELGGAPGLLVGDVDLASVGQARRRLPVLANRRR